MILENEFIEIKEIEINFKKELKTKLQKCENVIKNNLLNDFKRIYEETGVLYTFVSGMGVHAYQKNGVFLTENDDDTYYFLFENPVEEEKAYETIDQMIFEPINDLLVSYDNTFTELQSEFNYYVDFSISEDDVKKVVEENINS